jgi:iron complex transport system ATP-binding protein
MLELIAQDLSLAYQGNTIIQDLSLTIPAEKITVLVGANGCGKSTLLKGLARLLKPTRGAVYLDGKSIFTGSTKSVARQLGILPQNPIAPEGLTVKDLVSQGRYPYQDWRQQWSLQDRQIVRETLEMTDLVALRDCRNANVYSPGCQNIQFPLRISYRWQPSDPTQFARQPQTVGS